VPLHKSLKEAEFNGGDLKKQDYFPSASAHSAQNLEEMFGWRGVRREEGKREKSRRGRGRRGS